jgi:hypothetical protein
MLLSVTAELWVVRSNLGRAKDCKKIKHSFAENPFSKPLDMLYPGVDVIITFF